MVDWVVLRVVVLVVRVVVPGLRLPVVVIVVGVVRVSLMVRSGMHVPVTTVPIPGVLQLCQSQGLFFDHFRFDHRKVEGIFCEWFGKQNCWE